jgi:hypothetical protein
MSQYVCQQQIIALAVAEVLSMYVYRRVECVVVYIAQQNVRSAAVHNAYQVPKYVFVQHLYLR